MKLKNYLYSIIILASVIAIPAFAQDEVEEAEEGMSPTRPHFDGSWVVNNRSVVVPKQGTFEFMIQHRFGRLENGISDLYGLYAPSNIRLGLNYTLFDNLGLGFLNGPLSVGIGSTKNNRIHDLNWKYGIIQQTENGKIPISVTYFGNVAMATARVQEDLPNGNESDRYSFFHQLIISKRFSYKFSLQVAPSISHLNVVDPLMENDHYAVAVAGRYRISPQSSIIFNFDQPITKHRFYNPQPNVGVGIEVATSAHSFQVFISNYSAISPQHNNFYSQNDPWGKGLEGFLLGFNINRLWAF